MAISPLKSEFKEFYIDPKVFDVQANFLSKPYKVSNKMYVVGYQDNRISYKIAYFVLAFLSLIPILNYPLTWFLEYYSNKMHKKTISQVNKQISKTNNNNKAIKFDDRNNFVIISLIAELKRPGFSAARMFIKSEQYSSQNKQEIKDFCKQLEFVPINCFFIDQPKYNKEDGVELITAKAVIEVTSVIFKNYNNIITCKDTDTFTLKIEQQKIITCKDTDTFTLKIEQQKSGEQIHTSEGKITEKYRFDNWMGYGFDNGFDYVDEAVDVNKEGESFDDKSKEIKKKCKNLILYDLKTPNKDILESIQNFINKKNERIIL